MKLLRKVPATSRAEDSSGWHPWHYLALLSLGAAEYTRGRSWGGGPGCGLAAQDRVKTGALMAASLPVATGTAWAEWFFHGAVGGQTIGWDFPYPSLPSVGPLLPGSFHCLPRAGKHRHVAPSSTSLGAYHLGPRGQSPAHNPPTCHLYKAAWVFVSLRSPIALLSFPF